jgi:cytochrome P450
VLVNDTMTPTELKEAPIPLHLGTGETGEEPASPQLLSDTLAYLIQGYRAHGPVFRTKFRGQDFVVIAGQPANDFFWQNPENWSYRNARPIFTTQFGQVHVSLLDGQAHARKRRLLKPGFSMEAIARHVPVLAKETASFLASHAGKRSDLMDLLMHLLITLNSRTLLKVDLTEAEKSSAIRFEEELMYGLNSSLTPDEHFGDLSYCSDKESAFALLDKQIAGRLNGERQADNLQALIDQETGAFGALTPEELRYDCYLLLIAGVLNTGRLITRCLERLDSNPAWIKEIRAELQNYRPESFARGLGAFPKLRSVIQETERLHPGLLFMFRRASRDLIFNGHAIPAGQAVLQMHTLPHFLPENYPNPFNFDPSRWLVPVDSRKTHVPFGGGSHLCLGMNISRLHTPIVLADLMLNYDVSFGYSPKFTYTLDPGMVRRKEAYPIQLSQRQ